MTLRMRRSARLCHDQCRRFALPGVLTPKHPAALRCDGPCRREQHICTALPSPPQVGDVGAYNQHCTGEEVEWRPPLL